MDANEDKGGSYIRQKDGSLKLVERTEVAAPAIAPAEAETAAPKTPAAKKENTDG